MSSNDQALMDDFFSSVHYDETKDWRKTPASEPPEDDAVEKVDLGNLLKYDPSEARDDKGRWTLSGSLIVYHGTTEANAESIKAVGLDSKLSGHTYGISRKGKVYVTAHKEEAEFWAKNAKLPGQKHAVVEIHIPPSHQHLLSADKNADKMPPKIRAKTGVDNSSMTYTGSIPAAWVHHIHKSIIDSDLLKLLTDDQAADHHPSPSQAQITAGNYKKGHLLINGLNISIENSAGTKRRPEWPALNHHYGYIRGTTGNDGDHTDCFVRNQISKDYDGDVFVINQNKSDGSFDEHKCMIGWSSEWEAKAAYLENYTKGWSGIGSIKKFSFDEFKQWVRQGNHSQIAM